MSNEKKLVQCEHCGAPIADSAKVCPQCGAKHKKPIYKRGWFIAVAVVLVLSVFGAMGSGEEDPAPAGSTSQEETEAPAPEIVYTAYSVGELEKDLDENALKAAEKYKDQYVELTGRLSVIDSSGKYISITDPDDPFDLLGVQCRLQDDEQKAAVMELSVDDLLVVQGQITDVGEIMSYMLDTHTIVKK